MAQQGDLYLKNEALVAMYEAINTLGETTESTLYEAYKNTFKLSKSNYFRGTAADSFKGYISRGDVNVITEMMDIVSDFTMIIQVFTEAYYQYENTTTGKVDEDVLDQINTTLAAKEKVFDDSKQELTDVLALAEAYIDVQDLSVDTVNDGYENCDTKIQSIRDDLYAVEEEAVKAADDLYDRITKLKTFITSMMNFCYNEDGTLNTDNLNYIDSQDWFYQAGNVALYMKLQEDPFAYAAGETTLAEDQWSVGLCSDVYAYAGYQFLSASGEAGVENNTAFAKGKVAALNANGYAQFTDYLSAKADIKMAYAEGEAKAGLSKDYVGFKVDGKVGLIDATGTVVLGSDNLNAFVKGQANLLCADGKVAFQFEDDGQYAVGFDANATVASATLNAGMNILSCSGKDTLTGEKLPLLGFKLGGGVTEGVHAAAWLESKTAIETPYVNVNSTTVKLKLGALVRLDGQVTFPTLAVHF